MSTSTTAAASVPAPAPDPEATARSLGLTEDEYARIVATLGRVPSSAELGTFSVMWSEHCSYKSSKPHLRRLPTDGPAVLVGPGENAGVVDVGGGLAVTFKIESHNHPSFVEPFQGATTGVGGIVRDILTMGARPIAILDSLRFGDPADPTTRWIVDGVVRGVGHYGNSLGVPTVGGETAFDPVYAGNPLVNALCVGVLPADAIQLARAEQVGDVAVLIGQRTGRDGIGGASVLASAEFDEGGVDDAKRPNVQVGDPFAGSLLIEACLELYRRELVRGIQDMGAAGIACSSSEMAANARLGMRLDLDLVPLREPTMDAWEILCSESQERMLALVAPPDLDEVLEVCRRWGIDATPIGEVVAGDRLICTHHGRLVHDAPAAALVDEGPVYDRPRAPWRSPVLVEADPAAVEQPGVVDLHDAVRRVLTWPSVAPADWITRQYDPLVQSATVLGPGADAAVLRLPSVEVVRGERIVDGADAPLRGIAVATDGHGRWCALDPVEGARRVVAEAARNVACVGARPVAATNCLNFGSPESPDVMGSFSDVIDGMAEACSALGAPITGGNVSLYNQTGAVPIHPTPVVGVLGVLDDVTTAVRSTARRSGDRLAVLGGPTRPGLAGSAYQAAVEGRLAGALEPMDLDAEAALQRLLGDLAGRRLLASAHDVADGGLVTALVETLEPEGLGARIDLGVDAGTAVVQELFSEFPGRVVVTVDPDAADEVRAAAADAGVGWRLLGEITEERSLVVGEVATFDLGALAAARAAALPAALGDPGAREPR